MNMKNNLKQLKIFSVMLFSIIAFTSQFNAAQAQDEEITDEELKTYAVVMDSIDAMKATIQKELNDLIQSEELMDGGRKYVEIQGAADDSVKLKELEVTDEEMMVYNNIQAKYEEMTNEFKENYTTLIKDDLGGTAYNKITKAINSDAAVKSRYQEILAEVKQKREAGGTEEEVEASQAPVEG